MKKNLILLILTMSLLVSGVSAAAAEETELSLLAINVGKADSLLLRSGTSAYLIDTGAKVLTG